MKLDFSRVISGCMSWGKWGKQLSKNEMIDLLAYNVEIGITTFDHADIYGDYTTEIAFGEAFGESNISRESIQLISKCGIQYIGETRDNKVKHYQYDSDYIIWSAEKSISDLQADYLDLFLLHRPSPLMKPDEIAKAIDHLKSQGKIKHFGVSNFTPSQTALVASKVEVEANQIEFSLTTHQAMLNGSLDDMILNGVVPICWSPLGNVFKEETAQTNRIKGLLQELCDKYNASEDELLLAWILKHPAGIYPVVGTTNKERLQGAIKSLELVISEEDWFRLWVESMGHKVP